MKNRAFSAIGHAVLGAFALMLVSCGGASSSSSSSTTTTSTDTTVSPKAATPATPLPTDASKRLVGMNLGTLTLDTAETPLMNRAKLGGAWGIRSVQTISRSWLNADGFPIVSAPNGDHWESNVPLDPVTGSGFDQTYVLRWKGTGTLDVGLAQITARDTNRVTFTNQHGFVLVNINSTTASDPVRDISVVRADQVAAYDAGEQFNPSFVNRVVKPFHSFRTMDWDLTNNSTETNWTDRQKPTDANFTRMPLELEVALANEAGVDLWKNIPAQATDDYIRQTVSYIKANLSPSLKLHLEYSNEVWNTGFTQTTWAGTQAQNLWNISTWGATTFYGYRAAQMASIAWSVFGADSTQLKPVLAGWFSWTGTEVRDAAALGVSKAKLGSIASLFREYAIAAYFGDALGAGFGNEADRAIVLDWAKDPTTAGLDKAFQQLEHGGLLAYQGSSLDDDKNIYEPVHAAWAKANGLTMVGYEGGLAFYYFLADQSTKATLTDFYNRLAADPRMGTLYTRWLNDFKANGGAFIEAYNDVGTISEFGPWGALPSIYAPDTPRFAAMRTMDAQ